MFESPELRSAEERHHRLTPPLFPLLPIIPSAPRTWAGNGVGGARREPHRYPGAGAGSLSHGAGTRLRPVTFATHCPLPRLSGHSVRPGHGTETQNRNRRPRDAGPSVRVGLLHQRAERSRKPAAPLDGTGPGRRRQPFVVSGARLTGDMHSVGQTRAPAPPLRPRAAPTAGGAEPPRVSCSCIGVESQSNDGQEFFK